MATYSGSDGRTFEIACPEPPPDGGWMRETQCCGCGKRALEIADGPRQSNVRCDGCGRAHHGAALSYYGTGRALLYAHVPKLLPHRRDPEHGGSVALPDFYAELDDQKLPPDKRPPRCDRCAALIDPAARTVEHPNRHPTCVRGWAHIPEGAPAEIPLTEGS